MTIQTNTESTRSKNMHSKREALINSALNLFKHNGINTTGVEAIVSQAGVSKKTLYNHFKSKEELLLAVLRKDDELGRNALMQYAEKQAETPEDKILAIFDFYGLWFNGENFKGCFFSNSAAEIADELAPSRRICAEHKLLIANYIQKLATQAGVNAPEELAWQLNLLLEGSIVYASVIGDKQAATKARKMAGIILNDALPQANGQV